MQSKTDKELLDSYAKRGVDAAFAELVARYSPMVYRVCRRLLGNDHDAEDATQAAFVVLARKAGSLRQEGRLNGWLHRVARLVSLEALRKRTERERHQMESALWQEGLAPDPSEADRETVLRQVDTSLDSLSVVLREAVVLRYLRGFSEQEAATQAGCPVGTMKWRASEGLAKLRARLSKRGIALSGVALAGLLTSEASAAVPETLLPSILAVVKFAAVTGAAATGVSTTAAMLAKGATKAMFMAKVKMVAVACAVAVVAGSAVPVGLAVAHALSKEEAAQPSTVPIPARAPAAVSADEGEAMWRRGVARMRSKDFETAIQTFETLLQTYPDAKAIRPEALYWLGDCYSRTKDPAAAKRVWEKLNSEFPESNWGKYARGRLTEAVPVTVPVWRHITHKEQPLLPGDEIQFIKKGWDEKEAWIGTFTGAVRFKKGEMFPLKQARDLTVWDITKRPEGGFWIGHESGALLVDGDRTVSTLKGLAVPLIQMVGTQLWSIAKDQVRDRNTLMQANDEDWDPVAVFKSRNVLDLVQDAKGIFWLVLDGDGVVEIDPRRTLGEAQQHLSRMNVTSILTDSKDQTWCGLMSGGVMMRRGGVWERLLQGENTAVLSLIEDKDGTIWAATSGNGVWAFDGTDWKNMLRDEGAVNLLTKTSDGRVWISTPKRGGLRYWDGKEWKISLDNSMPMRCLMELSNGVLIAGGVLDGLYFSSLETVSAADETRKAAGDAIEKK